jgi:hypothetical protein
MANTRTFSETRTRTEAVHDQFDMFLQYAGIGSQNRSRILKAVDERWIERVGVSGKCPRITNIGGGSVYQLGVAL